MCRESTNYSYHFLPELPVLAVKMSRIFSLLVIFFAFLRLLHIKLTSLTSLEKENDTKIDHKGQNISQKFLKGNN